MTKPPEARCTIAQAAKALGVPAGTLYSWRTRGLLHAAEQLRDGTFLYELDEIRQVAAHQQYRPRRRVAP